MSVSTDQQLADQGGERWGINWWALLSKEACPTCSRLVSLVARRVQPVEGGPPVPVQEILFRADTGVAIRSDLAAAREGKGVPCVIGGVLRPGCRLLYVRREEGR